jgi:hypothetical protein
VTVQVDARTLNWRFVVPDEPEGLLYLPVNDERVPLAVVAEEGLRGLAVALRGGPYPAVAAPDLGRWARNRPAQAGRMLARLSAAVAPGGWLCAGFANANYPATPALTGALRIRSARRILRRAGLSDLEVYYSLPNQRCPALLVPAARPVELNHVLRYLFLTYLPGEGPWAAAQRHLLTLLRRGALRTPHGIRTRFAPGFYVIARRPA